MLLSAYPGSIAAAGAASDAVPGQIAQLGAWPLNEISGTTFADSVGTNDAILTVPSWTIATHEHNRPGIVAGTDHALEISNGGPAIPMAAGYKQAAMSLVIYVEPRGEQRGTQYWNTADERYGREFIAHSDDGSTPGSFAIERRRFSDTEWRLDGYVRNGSGTAVRFSGGLSGIAGATLPVDTAKRVVVTQGSAGATLYLDGVQVANLPSVTLGWSSLTTAITLGSSSNTGHANDRSSLWGRLDQIEVWQGQMALADVLARPAAAQSLLYRIPTDGPLINIASHGGNVQTAMDAAAAAGGYLYQDAANTTWYALNKQSADTGLFYKAGCRGMVGMRLKWADGAAKSLFGRLVNMGDFDGGQMGSHGDPYAGSGGYKFVGCKFDGNSGTMDWHPATGQPGFTFHGFDLQQVHLLRMWSVGGTMTVRIDACEFYNGTGDAISAYRGTNATATSCRAYGVFRGGIVINDSPVTVNIRRFESFETERLTGVRIGCGFDYESFGNGPDQVSMADYWADGDWDDEMKNTGSNIIYYNVHVTRAGVYLNFTGTGSLATARPIDSWAAYYCTMAYHHHYGNWPPSWWPGHDDLNTGLGALFDNCVFMACGDTYVYHNNWIQNPDNSTTFALRQTHLGLGPRFWTMRNCQWRAKNLPSGIAQSLVRCIDFDASGTAKNVELDGVTIDGAFADLPFNFGGLTVRHRNVLHERTGNSTPWTGAGAEVPL